MTTTNEAAPEAPAVQAATPAAQTPAPTPTPASEVSGVFAALGALPLGALITEPGLAKMLGKCTASIKAAVERGELPRPARLMGKNTWTAGAIIRHHENRLDAEGRKYRQLRT